MSLFAASEASKNAFIWVCCWVGYQKHRIQSCGWHQSSRSVGDFSNILCWSLLCPKQWNTNPLNCRFKGSYKCRGWEWRWSSRIPVWNIEVSSLTVTVKMQYVFFFFLIASIFFYCCQASCACVIKREKEVSPLCLYLPFFFYPQEISPWNPGATHWSSQTSPREYQWHGPSQSVGNARCQWPFSVNLYSWDAVIGELKIQDLDLNLESIHNLFQTDHWDPCTVFSKLLFLNCTNQLVWTD